MRPGKGLIVLLAMVLVGIAVVSNLRPAKTSSRKQARKQPPAVRPRLPLPAQNPIEAENRLAGTREWKIPNLDTAAGIEGYADRTSALPGETVNLYVSTQAASFKVDAYRMGYYGGAGGRLIWSSASIVGKSQPPPTRQPVTNMVEAHWTPSLPVTIPKAWPPGEYLFKLVGEKSQQRYIPLVVRDTRPTALLIQNSVTTWQAYNLWGGYSTYQGPKEFSDFENRARVVSFDRPLAGDGAGEFFLDEFPLVSLAESLGLDVGYWTDVDLHQRPEELLKHRGLITLGHDEYWSTAMRRNAEAARDKGVNLAFMGANAVFRRIRFEPSPLGPDRHEVNYKRPKGEPLLGKQDEEVTTDWREPPRSKPESSLVGDFYECNPTQADMVISKAESWVFEGTGLKNGDRIEKVVGPEYDRVTPEYPTPPTIEVLAHSPLKCRNKDSFSDVAYYTTPAGSGVFATGTIWWICEISAICPQDHRPAPDPRILKITENVLRAFAEGPAGQKHPSQNNLAVLGITKPK